MAEDCSIQDCVTVQQVRLRAQSTEGFVSEKKDLVSNMWLDWEPVEVYEGGGDVYIFFSVQTLIPSSFVDM